MRNTEDLKRILKRNNNNKLNNSVKFDPIVVPLLPF